MIARQRRIFWVENRRGGRFPGASFSRDERPCRAARVTKIIRQRPAARANDSLLRGRIFDIFFLQEILFQCAFF